MQIMKEDNNDQLHEIDRLNELINDMKNKNQERMM